MTLHRNHPLRLAPLGLAVLCVLAGTPGQAVARDPGRAAQAPMEAPQRFIIKYRNDSLEHRDAAARERSLHRAASAVQVRDPSARGGMRAIQLQHVRRMALGADVIVSSHALDRVSADTLMRRLASDPRVEYVEVDARMRPALEPNDPQYVSAQWHYKTPIAGRYGINAPAAWDRASGAGVVVAVLDTGSTVHSDMQGQTVPGYDFIADLKTAGDGDGRDADPSDPGDGASTGKCRGDSSWHGTHVAGTIAAATSNGSGVAGVAHGARVQHVRVLGKCGGWISDIADAMVWASGGSVAGVPANATPAKVLNLSLGGSGSCSATYQNAINAAVSRGATIVVAAGNDSGDASRYQPSSCQNVIAVGASSPEGLRAIRPNWWSSNYGAAVDLAAPGMDVVSTVNTGRFTPGAEGYDAWDGTSMATPHVAGIVALMQSVRPTDAALTPAQVEQLLKANVTMFPSTPDRPIGAGIANADAAVLAALAF